jgi:ferritin-like protein
MSKHRIYSGLVGLVAAENGVAKIASMTWKDHLTMLLHIAAEIEHSLMVQYLYAAYSLGGEQVPPDWQQMVRCWQEDILAVAREEMGHLLTVQNILMLIGAPINLDRQDLPWDIPFHPGTFRLERLTLESVASYVFAEMPSGDELDALIQKTDPRDELLGRYKRFKATDLEQIEIMVRNRDSSPHRVGDLYSQLTTLVANPHHIPDSVFQEWTLTHQASADDWGRGYRPDPRLVTADGSFAAEPDKPVGSGRPANVLIYPVATRTQVRQALEELSAQGEGPVGGTGGSSQLSHFDRFLKIYQEFKDLGCQTWSPSRPVVADPSTLDRTRDHTGYIAEAHSRDWAELFNLRYRMLLKYLGHTFRLARTQHGDSPNLRSMVMHRVFGEMYNLKAVAAIIVRQPLSNGSLRAGPPFEMPYSLSLPDTERDIWASHRDLLAMAQQHCKKMLAREDRGGHAYLRALFALDRDARTWAESILAGLGSMEGPQP